MAGVMIKIFFIY